ncbi:helix-turn-helix domain-containing protein [Nocardioides sp. 31GB23]|uniref:helix-turn-helix domain-containing protein n=1 Tax=Nocardioides sp. 31GB23 TaxID=3156065 RepID=UPI0032AEAFDB
MDQLLTTAEVAEHLRVTPETLRLWRHRKQGPPSYKYGRQVVYRLDELERWFESCRTEVPA